MKQNEQGRSMIEMLGVLGIVGLLSVLGIAGYTKAMAKMKINKTIQEITQITQQTRIAFGSQRNYSGLGESDQVADVMFTADLAPKEMLPTDSNGEFTKPYVFRNPFKGVVSMRYTDNTVVGDKMAFVVHLEGLPKAACIAVAISDWGGANGNGYIGLVINQAMPDNLLTSTCVPTEISLKGKATFCAKKGTMPIAAATNACSNQNGNTIDFKFY